MANDLWQCTSGDSLVQIWIEISVNYHTVFYAASAPFGKLQNEEED